MAAWVLKFVRVSGVDDNMANAGVTKKANELEPFQNAVTQNWLPLR